MSHRLQWSEMPAGVRDAIASRCGSPVVEATGQAGGYGPGLATRAVLGDGRRVFIKAASPAQNPETPGMVRREVDIIAALPPDPPAPELIHVIDDGTWIVLIFEDIDGRLPATPWKRDELARVVEATVALADVPLRAPLPTVAGHFGPMFHGWRTLSDEGPDAVADPWCRAHLQELVALEPLWTRSASGDHLVHGDVRSDNVLLTPNGDVVFVDWTSSCVGAAWFDLVCMLPSIELEGGGTPESVLELAGLSLGRAVLLPVVVALAGYFVEGGRRPDPPGLPTVREFQRAQGHVTVAWMQRLWSDAPGAG